ncbi:penicillin acylase family protein [Marinicella meishanensis]|uniref:penicillin acylase family protein n=1 Tax=Marinicella meishanensis TaxID=2873263 RepID=UPI001CC0B9C8|nr:penicillin acylase family protein [Marinicella sp. NBU2979]
MRFSQIKGLCCGLFFTASAVVSANETIITNNLLSAPAKVYYNETQIPSITAATEEDASFVLGYLHAKDRLFQMDYTRKIAQGKLSELVGPAALSNDIQFRTIGFERTARRSLPALSAKSQGMLKAYADGVNAWLDNNHLPVEYAGLELTEVDRWLPVHSVAIAKLIAFDLSNDLQEIDATIAINTFQQVGAAAGFDGTALFFEDLYRAAPPDDRVSVPGFLGSIGGIGKSATAVKQAADDFSMSLSEAELQMLHNIKANWESTPLIKALKNDGNFDKGSNVWVIAGENTDSGFPLIANDPHLSLDYPSTFYPAHMAAETGLNVAGVGFPGAPVTAQGCNENLCWGSTVHPVDETDFYFESYKANTFGIPTHTIYQGQEEPIVWVFQTYQANVIGDGVMNNTERQEVGYTQGGLTFLVPRRNFGPILDVDTSTMQAVSMQYTGFGPTKEIEAFFEMARAANIDEFATALTKFDVGSQNFGVVDRDGNIGYFTGAEVPIREDLQTLMQPDGTPPMFIRDGTGTRMNEWMTLANPDLNQATPYEVIPFAEMPFSVNPDSGYVANANNDPIGVSLDNNVLNQVRPGGGLYYISQGGYSSYRQGRLDRLIQQDLADGVRLDSQRMKEYQANNQLLDAELIMPHVMNAVSRASASDAWPGIAQFLADPRVVEAAGYFSTWDFSSPTGLAEGYDPFDNPFALSAPSDTEVAHSIAASIYSVWRGKAINNTIDVTLAGIDSAIGQNLMTANRPGSRFSINAFQHFLDAFDNNQGFGVSGINFFTNPQAPSREDARDFVILASLQQALDAMAGDDFAAAFGNSSDLADYQWGKLHRIVFSHPLGDALSVPNGLFGLSTVDGLAGVARSGGYQVLDASSHSTRADGSNDFMFSSGPARRFVAEVTPLGILAEQIIPGGQSGVITAEANYVNQLFLWLVNGYLPLITDLDTIVALSLQEYDFLP